MNFTELHQQDAPTLICNVWDVNSAQIAERLSFQAIGTSSGAIASMLGYQDGEGISFSELVYIVERITKSTNIPLTVDLEAGYSRDPAKIVEHIKQLADLGVFGVNIEDSLVTTERKIVATELFSQTLEQVCATLTRQNVDVFVNVRTDTFLLGLPNPLQQTIDRAKAFKESGAHGLFVPCVVKANDIKAITGNTPLPLNVMAMPDLPKFSTLQTLGVKRISMGNFVYQNTANCLLSSLENIQNQQSFTSLFS